MMNQRIGPLAWFVIISLISVVHETSSFAFSQHHVRVTKSRSCRVGLLSSLGENEGQTSAQKKQEQIMERASIAGAEEIAKVSLEERTKRAMLAEAVEDRIFDLVDELDILVAKNGGLENLSGEIKEEAVEMAKQTKALQIQYDDLVNGRPSQILEMEMKESN
mmetsp:Transcript_20474/g.33217  ORF Transcript_20474/g.33217 Transcript_20474/m.33217 type:complete len:163 (+) Transcript_20474:69-557(+)